MKKKISSRQERRPIMRMLCCSVAPLFLLISGCGGDEPRFTEEELATLPLAQRQGLPAPSGGFVLTVGGETITADEIAAPLIEHYRPLAQAMDLEDFESQARTQVEQLIINRISNILLYNEAKKGAGEHIDEVLDKAVETEVKGFIVRFNGDYARAEAALHEQGMDWQSFKEYQKKMIMSQSYLQSKLPQEKPVTHSELVEYYENIKEKSFNNELVLELRVIDIQPARLELSDGNKSRIEQAKVLAYELLARIHAGEDFGELARQYSHGHRASFGGLWRPVRPGSLAKPYDILGAEGERIEPGEVTGPIETGEHIFIMKLEAKQAGGIAPFKKVQKEVEAQLVLERQRKTLEQFSARIVRLATISNKEEFVDFCLRKTYAMIND